MDNITLIGSLCAFFGALVSGAATVAVGRYRYHNGMTKQEMRIKRLEERAVEVDNRCDQRWETIVKQGNDLAEIKGTLRPMRDTLARIEQHLMGNGRRQ